MRVMLPSLLSRSLSSPLGKSAGAAAFDPLSLSPHVWYDFSDITTLLQASGGAAVTADGDPIGYVADKSGNTRHLTQGSPGAKPTYKTNVKNGLSVARFDGGDALIKTGFSLSQPTHYILVVIPGTRSGQDNILDGVSARQVIYINTSGNYSLYANSVLGSSSAASSGNADLLYAIFNGASSSLTRDGVSIASGNAGASGLNGIVLGADNAGAGDQYTGDICEVFAWNGTDSTNAIAYFNNKWAVYP